MKVRELFEQLRGRHVALLPNHGNCGDGLIQMGFRQLCEEYFVRYTSLLSPRPACGRVLLVLGAGNLSQPFHHQVPRIRRYVPMFEKTYLLPSSIDPASPAVAELLQQLPPNVVIFCRERFSAEKIAPLVSGKNDVHLDHDLAFALTYEPWKQTGAGRLNAFRTDLESCGAPLPPHNLDLSLWGDEDDGDLLLRNVAGYSSVHTDRAHVAICAAMLGKETHLYPNNYHKVRGIFEFSLRAHPNVTFHETFPCASAAESGNTPFALSASAH
jgi:exopolysaccharide biosynthesis predicted pyruvyltransferase EpsI